MLLNAKVGHFNTEFMGADFLFLIFILKSPLKELVFFFWFFCFVCFFNCVGCFGSYHFKAPHPVNKYTVLKKEYRKGVDWYSYSAF